MKVLLIMILRSIWTNETRILLVVMTAVMFGGGYVEGQSCPKSGTPRCVVVTYHGAAGERTCDEETGAVAVPVRVVSSVGHTEVSWSDQGCGVGGQPTGKGDGKGFGRIRVTFGPDESTIWFWGNAVPPNTNGNRCVTIRNPLPDCSAPMPDSDPDPGPDSDPDPGPDPDPDPGPDPDPDPGPEPTPKPPGNQNPPPRPPSGGGPANDDDEDDDDESTDSGVVRRTGCAEPEAGTRIWRWIKDEQESSILQLEASTRGKDTEQEIYDVLTLFTPERIDEKPAIVVERWNQSRGWDQQVEQVGDRNRRRLIGEDLFYVNHFRVAPSHADYGIVRARNNILVDERRFELQRRVSHSILTGCGIYYLEKKECVPEAGSRLWRWVNDSEDQAILQLEATTLGKDGDQEISPVVTIFTPQEIPEDHVPAIRAGFRYVKVKRVGEMNRTLEIDEKDYFVNDLEASALGGHELSKAGWNIQVDEWRFRLQRPILNSIITGCR